MQLLLNLPSSIFTNLYLKGGTLKTTQSRSNADVKVHWATSLYGAALAVYLRRWRAAVLTDVVEGAAGGWRDLQEARVDEGSEGGRRLVFLHVVAGLALRRQGATSAGEQDETAQMLQTLGAAIQVKGAGGLWQRRMHVRWAHRGRNDE